MSEYKPTEYIVDFGDSRSNRFVRLNMAMVEQNSARLHEEIVRCRDCCNGHQTPVRGFRCWRWMEFSEECDPVPAEVAPDGYCAWGERRDG